MRGIGDASSPPPVGGWLSHARGEGDRFGERRSALVRVGDCDMARRVGAARHRAGRTLGPVRTRVISAALCGALTACGWPTGAGQPVLPDETGCLVEVANELLPVHDRAERTSIRLSPPYQAEMGWRLGGPENYQVATVVIHALVAGAAILEHRPPGSEESYSQVLTADELQAGAGRSLTAAGLHRFSLRGVDGSGCSQSFTIDAYPDSRVRAVDRVKGGSQIGPPPAPESSGE